jgi:hypothetical protein
MVEAMVGPMGKIHIARFTGLVGATSRQLLENVCKPTFHLFCLLIEQHDWRR